MSDQEPRPDFIFFPTYQINVKPIQLFNVTDPWSNRLNIQLSEKPYQRHGKLYPEKSVRPWTPYLWERCEKFIAYTWKIRNTHAQEYKDIIAGVTRMF